MAEYIERNSLIIDIQSRKLADIVPNCNEPIIRDALYKQGQAIKKIITEFPTADVVEVVRCKDCRMFVENKKAFVAYCKRELKNLCVKPDDYCSYGEKRSSEE